MSLSRNLFRELRPFFRMLEEPITRPSTFGVGYPATRSLFDEAFFGPSGSLRPAVDVSEQGDTYIVEAELPGVKKENVNVRIGDGGRSLTIEGKVFKRAAEPQAQDAAASESTSTEVTTQTPEQTAISTERMFNGTSSFTRTVLLPEAVDSHKVTAKLTDGVLTVTIPKAADTGSVQVNVD
ncbi:HSP20-like chaperone [Daedaleopsis nitida]|nr:HSP20-like chaperone [Daedaleopsis nitida]